MGFFKRDTQGHVTPPIPVDIERGAIAGFASAIGARDSIHSDPDAARAAGYADVVAPPTYATVVDMAAAHASARAGHIDALTLVGADVRYLLHGSERYRYHAPILAGRTVKVSTHITGFSDAKGGKLEIAHLETRITGQDGEPLVSISRDLIHRLG
jgi:acyl dehydratase